MLLGCTPPEAPWERIDLALADFAVESAPGRPGRAAREVISFLGGEEVRDMRLVPESQLAHFPKRTAGQVRALEQKAGSRLVFRLTLGRESYLSFVPLGTLDGCACAYRVSLRRPGEEAVVLHHSAVEPLGFPAPATVEVGLPAGEVDEVELILEIEGQPAAAKDPVRDQVPRALWGSPAVYSRKGEAQRTAALSADAPNVLFIGLDTVRADALGAWGREPSLTPSLDRLADESDVWLDAFSTFNATNPSFVSMMTGLYGKDHGVYDLMTPLPERHTTLAEVLAGASYQTFAVISARHLGHHASGLGQGFAEMVEATEHLAAELAVDSTMGWLARRDRQRPFFAWLHLFDPHTPHTPPAPYALGSRPAEAFGLSPVAAWTAFRPQGPRTFDEPVLGGHRDLYDGEIAYLDRQVGRLLDFLEGRRLLDTTIVVVVADHGESLGEHGVLYRHVGLHDTTTRVPMMIRWPDAAERGRRFAGLVQTIDLFPTLLRAAGVAAERVPAQDGIDLAALTPEPGARGRRVVFAEHSNGLGEMVRTTRHKYLTSRGNRSFPDGPALHDVAADPGETASLAGRSLPLEAELRSLLERWLAHRRPAGEAPRPRDLAPEDVERLKALGYL